MLYFVQVITIVAMALLHTKCVAKRTGIIEADFQGVNYCSHVIFGQNEDTIRICKATGDFETGSCDQVLVEFLDTIGQEQRNKYILVCKGKSVTKCLTTGGKIWPYIGSADIKHCKLWEDDEAGDEFLEGLVESPKIASTSQTLAKSSSKKVRVVDK